MDIEALRHFRFDEIRQSYSKKDTILYALGLGYGSDPLNPDELRFTYEQDLHAVPWSTSWPIRGSGCSGRN